MSVRWRYGGPSAHLANELFRADPEMRFASVDAPTYGSKGLPHGVLLVEIGLSASHVTVSYELK